MKQCHPSIWKAKTSGKLGWWKATCAFLLACMSHAAFAADLPEIRQRGVLRVIGVISNDGGYFISGDLTKEPGFDHEILLGFGRMQRVRVELVSVGRWDQLIPTLLEGKGDVIAGSFTMSDLRRQQIDFTAETFPTRSVIVNRKPNAPIMSLDHLRLLPKIGTIRGSAQVELLRREGIADSAIVPLDTGIGDALRSGRVPSALEALEIALPRMLLDPDLQLGAYVGPPGSLAFGVRKSDTELRDVLSEYIINIRRSGGWNRLVVKYFGTQAAEIIKKARPLQNASEQ